MRSLQLLTVSIIWLAASVPAAAQSQITTAVIDGTVVDFYDGLEKRGFVFNNTNVAKSCGCGSSFQV